MEWGVVAVNEKVHTFLMGRILGYASASASSTG